jgi:hypothetical protein
MSEPTKKERDGKVIASQIDIEVAALLALLKQIGLGDEIAHVYQPLSKAGMLTSVEIDALSEPVRKYIGDLKEEISHLLTENERMKNQIRKTNWDRSR